MAGGGGVAEGVLGDVGGDLASRRGQVQGAEARGEAKGIRAQVPLAEMFGYATELRSMTRGRASHTMEFSCYEPVPASVAKEVVAARQKEKASRSL